MSLTEIDLLAVYQALLLCAAIGTLVAGLHRARKWIARYHQLYPKVLQHAVKQGVYAALKRHVREEWPKLLELILLLLILAGLTIAVRMIW